MTTAAELFDLTGRVAVVTGGSRGIGRGIVMTLARAGADVVIASRKLEACKATADDVRAETGRKAVAVECHVGKWEDCDRLADVVYDELGRCDVLVNNAGSSPLYPDLASVSQDYYDKVHAVNARGPFRLSALIGTRMFEGDGGSIINIGSIESQRPSSHALVYSMAKAGMDALTLGLAEAFGPKVRANSILPGPFATDIAEHWTEATKQFATQNPMGRMGEVDDIVGLALYFASDASRFTTGTITRVDGGAYRAP
jgi:NAD(P)-dependent dehydrogenase (short-subunit alcohol dehydrogenase family)